MKKLLTLLCVFSFTELTFADDHVNGTWVAAEYYFCNFNEGQDMDDLKRGTEFNRFLDKYRDVGDYDAVLLVETYDQDRDFDYIWSGHWLVLPIWLTAKIGLIMAVLYKLSLIKFQNVMALAVISIFMLIRSRWRCMAVDYSYCKLNDGMESMDAIKLMDKNC